MARPESGSNRSPWRRGRLFWGMALLVGVCGGALLAMEVHQLAAQQLPDPSLTPAAPQGAPVLTARADDKQKDPAPPSNPKEEPTEPKKAAPANDARPITLSQDAAPKEKLISFDMGNKPWASVMDWYAQESGLPFVSVVKPPGGTFNFTPPRVNGQSKKYTLGDVTDILNEALIDKGFILLRREASFTLHPADEKISPAELKHVTEKELAGLGKKEVVQVTFRPNTLVAEDLVPEVKKILGPFGEVSALTAANQLIMQDQAGNLRRVIEMIRAIEENDKGGESFTYPCKYIKAREAERILKDLMGDPREQIRQLMAPQGGFRGFSGGGFRGDGGFRGGPEEFGGGPDPFRGQGFRGGPQPVAVPNKIRMHSITSDERTNSVLVIGPADKIAQAKQILGKLDVPQLGQGQVLIGPPEMKFYDVAPGTAEVMAKTLQEIYKNSPNIKVSAVGQSQILVYATLDDHFDIKKQLRGTTEVKTNTTELINLTILDAGKVADTLKAMFGDAKTGAPYVEADKDRNAIIVKGTPDQITEVKDAVKAMGESPALGSDTKRRIITLDKGSASNLAETIQRMMEQMGSNPVKVITPTGEPTPTPRIEEQKKEPKGPEVPPAKGKPLTGPGERISDAGSPDGVRTLLVGGQQPLFDPQSKGEKTEPKGKGAPVTITAAGGRLIIESDDPVALNRVTDLVRLLTKDPGAGDFTVLRLKNANAVEIAKLMDQWFNGTQPQNQQQQQGRFPFPFPLPFGGGQQQTTPAADNTSKVRIVADPNSNSLLVRASALDIMTMKSMLDKVLDKDDVDSNALVKTHLLKLEHANASDIAIVLRDVYRENMATTTTNNQQIGGGFPGFGFGGFGRFGRDTVDPSRNPKAAQNILSVGVDDRTNTLVLNCSQKLFEEIKTLVGELELGARDQFRTVKVVSIKGVDPVLVQQAIDAIQGRPIRRDTQNGMNRFGNGGNNFGGRSGFGSPFGGGGFGSPFGGGFGSPFGGGGFGSPFGGGGFGGRGGLGSPFGGGGPGGSGPGGGGGFRNRGGGGGQMPSAEPERGPDFFESRGTDALPLSVLYDPQLETQLVRYSSDDTPVNLPGPRIANTEAGRYVAQLAQQPEPKPPVPKKEPAKGEEGEIRAPRSSVNAEALEELGIIVISAQNAADLEEILKIIQYIQELGKGAEPQLLLLPMEHADATSVVNTMNQVFSRINVGAGGNIAIPVGGQRPGQQQPFGAFPFGGQQPQAQQQQAVATGVLLLPIPRFNAILIGAPRARIEDLVREIKKLDRPNPPQGQAQPIPLKKASASVVANLVQQFYNTRYPNETAAQNQVRVTFDTSTNTVFVQASPADLDEIKGLVERIDSTVSNAVNELKIIRVRNTPADELANTLLTALTQGIVPQSGGTTTPTTPTTPLGGGPLGGGPLAAAARPAIPGVAGVGGVNTTKTISLRFLRTGKDGVVESGLLEDVHITADVRSNSLIISAPNKTMTLLEALIRDLDVPAFSAQINVITLKRADAVLTANLLQQLLLGAAAARPTTPGAPTLPGVPTGPGATTTQGLRPLFSLTGTPSEGANLIELRIGVDDRTNSIIVSGTPNDLEMIAAIISRLEDAPIQDRRSEVIKLKNAAAADVVTALSTFFTNTMTVYRTAGLISAFQELNREVVVVAEPISNTVLVSATPDYFAQAVQMIDKMDAAPPQVMVQVLIADVTLSNSEEFGIEVGLQSPVLFQRSAIPSSGATFTGATGNLLPAGITVNSTIPQAAFPGFNFNSNQPLPGFNSLIGPGTVGFQGLGNLGTGRASSTGGPGGFIFSAASDTVSVLIRALKTQGRIDILNRSQVTSLDNQQSYITVGQSFPYISGAFASGLTNTITPTVTYRDTGVALRVTPRVSPDGTVLMRVEPSIVNPEATPVNLGNGLLATVFDQQLVQTTVLAADGETVVIGGLISKTRTRQENKIPWLGDLPLVGAAFRFRSDSQTKRELIVILTPHIIRCPADADRLLFQEAQRVHWVEGDIQNIHGPFVTQPPAPPAANGTPAPAVPAPAAPILPLPAPAPGPSSAAPAQQGHTTTALPAAATAGGP
jgi:type II secretion system protein D